MNFRINKFLIFQLLILFQFQSFGQFSVSWSYSVNKKNVTFNVTTSGPAIQNYGWTTNGSANWYNMNDAIFYTTGSYYTCLTAIDSIGDTAVYCDTVHIPCVSDFNVSKSGLTATFNNKSFHSGGASYWSFGDGNYDSTNSNPSHTYSAPGTYNACLYVSDSNNCSSYYCDSVQVDTVNTFLVSFTYNAFSPNIVVYPSISGSGSYTTSWYSPNATQTSSQSFRYSTPGTYILCLTVTDSLSNNFTYCDSVTVSCKSDFTYLKNKLNAQFTSSAYSRGSGNFDWDFGDGNSDSTSTNPIHNYAQPGTYQVCLNIYDSTLTCTDSYCDSIQVDSVSSFNASFTYTVNRGDVTFTPIVSGGVIANESWNYGGPAQWTGNNSRRYSLPGTYYVCRTVIDTLNNITTYCDSVVVPCVSHYTYNQNGLNFTFTDSSFSVPASYSWDFGDNSTPSTSSGPSHTYASTGSYQVCLTTIDTSGCTDTYCDSVDADTTNMWVSYTYSVSGKTVTFNTTSGGAAFTNYSWNYGGNTSSSTSNSATYSNPGLYYVCVTATDSLNNTAFYCDSVLVPCYSDFTSYNNQLQVQFYENSFANSGSTFSWNFGDGSGTVYGANPLHTYSNTGIYNVCLTTTDSIRNCSNTYCDSIAVDTANNIWVSFTYSTNGEKVSFQTQSNANYITSTNWTHTGASQTWGNVAKYPRPGTYYTCVQIQDTNLNTAFFCDSVLVPCQAKFTISKNLLNVNFTNTSFISGKNYSWNFGDGNSSSSEHPSHTYSAAGTYNVCLTVTDSLTNCTDVFCDSITVISSYQCSASFALSTPNAGLVSITDNSWSNYPTYRYWSMGNGDTLKRGSGNLTYQYNSNGTYNVCLTVKDTNSLCVSSICDTVTITNAPPPPPVIHNLRVNVFKDSSLFFDSLRVYLIMEDTTKSSPYLVAIDSMDIHGGVYPFSFLNLNQGTYYVKAALRPDAVNYSSILPTYFGNEVLWSNSTAIQMNGNKGVSIKMVKGTNPGGPGFISGYVSLGANLLPGDPIPGLDVLLMDEGDVPFAHIKSDQDGKYEFSNLPLGTYKIYVDLLNIPASPIYVTIDQTSSSSTGNNIEVNSTGVGAPVGITEEDLSSDASWKAYPNPFDNKLMVSIPKKKNQYYEIELYDMMGKVMERIAGNVQEEQQILELNTSKLPRGNYFLRVQLDANLHTIKVMKK